MSDKIRILEDVPFEGGANLAKQDGGDTNLIAAETTRAMQEAQAGFIMAKQFPRHEHDAIVRITRSCQRPTLAEKAMYAFPRGGSQVTGPSIRLAEVLAQQWGNINFGYRELHEGPGMTQVLAYAYDLETNTRAEKVFHVKHVRDTKQGTKTITDRRDLYELIANQAARRIRSCILQIIPGDVVEAAIEASQAALEKHEGGNLDERREKCVEAFKSFDVTKDMIEKRMGKKAHALLPADLVVLRNIHRSLSDGMSSVEQWFPADATERAKEKLQKATEKKDPPKKKAPKKKATEAPEPPPEPEGDPEPPEEPQDEPEPQEDDEEPESEELEGPPDEEEDEDDELDEMIPLEDVEEAIALKTGAGRPSNFQIQIENNMVAGMKKLLGTGVSDEDATEIAARSVYTIMKREGECDQINAMPVKNRVAFMNALKDWADDPIGGDDE